MISTSVILVYVVELLFLKEYCYQYLCGCFPNSNLSMCRQGKQNLRKLTLSRTTSVSLVLEFYRNSSLYVA